MKELLHYIVHDQSSSFFYCCSSVLLIYALASAPLCSFSPSLNSHIPSPLLILRLVFLSALFQYISAPNRARTHAHKHSSANEPDSSATGHHDYSTRQRH